MRATRSPSCVHAYPCDWVGNGQVGSNFSYAVCDIGQTNSSWSARVGSGQVRSGHARSGHARPGTCASDVHPGRYMGCRPPPQTRSALHAAAAGGAGPGKVGPSFRPRASCGGGARGRQGSPQDGGRSQQCTHILPSLAWQSTALAYEAAASDMPPSPPLPSLGPPLPKLDHPRLAPFSIVSRRSGRSLVRLLCQHLTTVLHQPRVGAGFLRDTWSGNPISHGSSSACESCHLQPPQAPLSAPAANDSLPKIIRPGPNVPPRSFHKTLSRFRGPARGTPQGASLNISTPQFRSCRGSRASLRAPLGCGNEADP